MRVLCAGIVIGLAFHRLRQRWDIQKLVPPTLRLAPRHHHHHKELPAADGKNIPALEWRRKVREIKKANGWNINDLLCILPTSLSGKILEVLI